MENMEIDNEYDLYECIIKLLQTVNQIQKAKIEEYYDDIEKQHDYLVEKLHNPDSKKAFIDVGYDEILQEKVKLDKLYKDVIQQENKYYEKQAAFDEKQANSSHQIDPSEAGMDLAGIEELLRKLTKRLSKYKLIEDDVKEGYNTLFSVLL